MRREPLGAADASRPVPPLRTLSCGSVERTPEALLITTPAVLRVEKVTLPLAERVVKVPVEGVVAPMAVALIPVAGEVKLFAGMRRVFGPVLIEEVESAERDKTPDVAGRVNAPVGCGSPFD